MLMLTCVAVELRAEVINFDDLPVDGGVHQLLDGYQGFHWTNFYVLNAKDFTDLSYMGPNGYLNGLVSGPNVAYNGYGSPALVNNGLFNFNSAYFNAAWNDGLEITVTGKLGASIVAVKTFTVDTAGPATPEVFNGFNGIDELDFQATGGTHHAGYNGQGTHFVMDNFDVTPLGAGQLGGTGGTGGTEVPEPGRLVGLAGIIGAAISLGLIGRVRRRRLTAVGIR
jgi:hypothetical protein